MAPTTTSDARASTFSMKLLVDTKAGRVLYAESGKDVVDFLFSLLALPVATAVKLLGKDAMVGCAGNLYASVEKLDSTYIQDGASKEALLSPTVLSLSSNNSLLRLPEKTFYRCPNTRMSSCCSTYVTCVHHSACPTCGRICTMLATAGFVQGIVNVKYMVLDDLTVTPMSTISGITLLNTLAGRDVGDLQEKNVQLGYNEGLAILKASLQSKTVTVLTDVFLGNNKTQRAVLLEWTCG
ncbi:uncharacterized protein LOC120674490 [Panicum virgatum]|uniref:Uncharacterized protein n=1 Tax=Panicum virgatum TaxID=38727 RepID=A0A8T0RP31_PANVG|nr:uncharacterized protein LOC120674490 [Panicum virgatum]KAG2586935.1 hypothetical protein PVAP13_5NG093000 [Panicum virgatum]